MIHDQRRRDAKPNRAADALAYPIETLKPNTRILLGFGAIRPMKDES